MGTEVKVASSVVGVLLVLFAGMVFARFRSAEPPASIETRIRTSEDAPQPPAEEGHPTIVLPRLDAEPVISPARADRSTPLNPRLAERAAAESQHEVRRPVSPVDVLPSELRSAPGRDPTSPSAPQGVPPAFTPGAAPEGSAGRS